MKQIVRSMVLIALLCASTAWAANVEYLPLESMDKVVKTTTATPFSSEKLPVPVILWGADVATIVAKQEGYFDKEGLQVELFREDYFPNQVERVVKGETPFLRGTVDMIISAMPALEKAGLDGYFVFQLSWSTNGDAIIGRNVTGIDQLRGGIVILQRFGPHVYYVLKVLADSSVKPNEVTFKWVADISLPPAGKETPVIKNPVEAFQNDTSVKAAAMVYVDAQSLVGEGGGEAVPGAKILSRTGVAKGIIADAYWVTKAFADANPGKIEGLVRAMYRGQMRLQELVKANDTRYQQILQLSSKMLLDSDGMNTAIDGMIHDCTLAGLQGNWSFFTGETTVRNLATLSKEIQDLFQPLGLTAKHYDMKAYTWDFAKLAGALGVPAPNLAGAVAAAPKLNEGKVAQKVASALEADDAGEFQIVIPFKAGDDTLNPLDYQDKFQQVLERAQTYSGAVITVEGYAGIRKYNQEKAAGKPQQYLNQMDQGLRNLSVKRATALRDAYIAFCTSKNYPVMKEQFSPVGRGIDHPIIPNPETASDDAPNRRAVIRVLDLGNLEALE